MMIAIMIWFWVLRSRCRVWFGGSWFGFARENALAGFRITHPHPHPGEQRRGRPARHRLGDAGAPRRADRSAPRRCDGAPGHRARHLVVGGTRVDLRKSAISDLRKPTISNQQSAIPTVPVRPLLKW